MHAFSYAWSLPVTWQRWWLHHSTCRTWKPLHINITTLYLIEWELLLIEVLSCGNRNFRPFGLLWPWPIDLHIRTRPVVRGNILSWLRLVNCVFLEMTMMMCYSCVILQYSSASNGVNTEIVDLRTGTQVPKARKETASCGNVLRPLYSKDQASVSHSESHNVL